MADLETRVEALEKKIPKIEEKMNQIQNEIHGSLADIKTDVVEIKQLMKDAQQIDELKNQLIDKEIEKKSEVFAKDVQRNTARIEKLESNQNKLVWTIILEVLGLVGAAVMAYLKMS